MVLGVGGQCECQFRLVAGQGSVGAGEGDEAAGQAHAAFQQHEVGAAVALLKPAGGGQAGLSDGGHSWTPAEITPRQDCSWQRFTLLWQPPAPGEYCVVSRATDSRGHRQPDAPHRNRLYRSIIHVRLDNR